MAVGPGLAVSDNSEVCIEDDRRLLGDVVIVSEVVSDAILELGIVEADLPAVPGEAEWEQGSIGPH